MLQSIQTLKETKNKDLFISVKQRIKKITLDNGLRVILMQNGSNPTVALYWKILAGSSDETESNAGIAHMLEHMLFKGTKIVGTIDYEREKKYLDVLNRWYHRLDDYKAQLKQNQVHSKEKLQELEKKIQNLERRISLIENEVKKFQISEEDSIIYSIHGQRGYNAYTSKDVTNYQIELPSNKIELWAKLESDRVKNSVFREFYTERNVVAEERMMRVENNPISFTMEKLLEAIYQGHPYGFPTIGRMENIITFKVEQAEEYYKNFYRPENTVIGMVGNFDEEEAIQILKKYFGDWENPKEPMKRSIPTSILHQNRKVVLKINKEGSPILLLAWLKPNFPQKEDLVLGILADVLVGRPDTRLEKTIIQKEQLATQIQVYTSYPGERYENLFLIFVYPNLSLLKNPQDEEELLNLYQRVQDGILRELQNIQEHGLDEKELERVKQLYLTNFIKQMRSNSYLAEILTYSELVYGDYHLIFDYYNQIENISVKDVQEVIRNYLSFEKMSRAVLIPKK